MTDFNDARSGIQVGVTLSGFGAVSFGVLSVLCLADVLSSAVAGRRVALTPLLVGGFGMLAALALGLSALSRVLTLGRWQRINDRGITAWATMGEPRRTNERLNRRNLHVIPLVVAPQRQAPYAVEARWFFPLDLRAIARPGMRVVVRIDPEDASSVLVDWDQTRAAWRLPQQR